jgi:molecular chaperone HtpG
MTTTAGEAHEYTFQAEIKRLLQLLANSLYQGKEIALRELISNASDALDKRRLIALREGKGSDGQPLEIRLTPDKDARTLTIGDNGVGMTRQELIENLGTIARSGSLEFLQHLPADQKNAVSLIGQFGVGFYSAFMIADAVTVRSKSEQDESGWEWKSEGTGSFTIQPAEVAERGTSIILHLKEDAKEFLEDWKLRSTVKKFSSFIPHPIKLRDEVLNDQKPIWVEPKSQISDEQYDKFYQHISQNADESPLWRLHVSLDAPIQFHAIVYCPRTNLELLGFGKHEHGLALCAKRVLVQGDCKELLPGYLRFLYGLVDSEDLPLNISRETLQDNTVLRKIRETLTKQVLNRIQKLSEEDANAYREFYQQFGNILKEGISSDYANRERLAKLLRFSSTTTAGESWVSLDEYIGRMPSDQTQVYFLGGPDAAALRKSPHLEAFTKRGLEVLLLTEPVDEFVLSLLGSYEGKRLISIDAADVELPPSKADLPSETPREEPSPSFAQVIGLFKEALGDRVEDVRESKRLVDAPCRLANVDGTMSSQMQRLLQMSNKEFGGAKRILELNPSSPLIKRLSMLAANPEHALFIKNCALQLWSSALMLEGVLAEPEDTVTRVQGMMEAAAQARSPIITG